MNYDKLKCLTSNIEFEHRSYLQNAKIKYKIIFEQPITILQR